MNKTIQLLIIGLTIILSSYSYGQTNKTPETEMKKVSRFGSSEQGQLNLD